MKGIWIDRSAFYNASRSSRRQPRLIDFREEVTLTLSPLPCWEFLSSEAYKQRVRDLVEEIASETAKRHRVRGTRPAGRGAALRMNPQHRPGRAKKRPAPLVHASTKKARQRIREAYRDFVRHFRAAAEALQELRPSHGFPEGAFPSPVPFIPVAAILEPE